MQCPRRVSLAAALLVAACGGAQISRSDTAELPEAQPELVSRYGASVARDIERVRAATAPFKSVAAAARAGYPAAVEECIRHPEYGAMGFHHGNPELFDDRLEVERPEMLVYERLEDGSYVLNGVEYVVPYTARPRDAEPPVILGQALKRADRLGLWYLHVWVWKENPAGLFADWNPRVECRG